MINLHERFSEFSYGYGVTREVENLLASVGLHATPFLPSLLHEAELGFDVSFQSPGLVVVLQFKLGQELQRFRRSDPAQPIPLLTKPFWRFRIDTAGHQFQRLVEFENADADVYYVAPRFSHWETYERAFQDNQVLEKSLILRLSEILCGVQAQGGSEGVHRIVYDRACRYVCSKPVGIREVMQGEMARKIGERARMPDTSLENQIQRLFHRPPTETGPTILTAARRERLFARSRRPVDAMAAIIGLEAWIQGAQLVFVTDAATTTVA